MSRDPSTAAPARTAEGDELRALLDAVLDPALAVDSDGAIVAASASVEPVLGWTPAELRGRRVDTLVAETSRHRHFESLVEARRGGAARILGPGRELELVRKDGSRALFEVALVRAGDGPVVVESFRDVTELERARRAEGSMERALAAIGDSASAFAHEIKNPITAVHLALRVVARELGEDEVAVLEDFARRLQGLESRVRRTLAYARPLEPSYGPVSVRELTTGVVARLRGEIDLSGADVRVSCDDATFRADRALLEDALAHLVRNALEAPARRVDVSGRVDAGSLVLAVDDDGPGPSLPPERLFQPFSSGRPDGVGLGLASCRKACAALGGSIESRRSALGGARFEIRLPPKPEVPR